MQSITHILRVFLLSCLVSLGFNLNVSAIGFTVEVLQGGQTAYQPVNSGGNVAWLGQEVTGTPPYDVYYYDAVDETVTVIDTGVTWQRIDIDGRRVVWSNNSPGSSCHSGQISCRQVYMYDGVTKLTTRLTETAAYGLEPRVDGDRVVWRGAKQGSSWSEIFMWDGTQTLQLTHNDYVNRTPVISGDQVAYLSVRESGVEQVVLYHHADTSHTLLTNDSYNNWNLNFSDGYIAWTHLTIDANGSGYELYLWDGHEVLQISAGGCFAGSHIEISGSRVVLDGRCYPGINYYDANTKSMTAISSTGDGAVISGDSLAWVERKVDTGSNEVYFWNGRYATRVTYDDLRDEFLSLSGSNITWWRSVDAVSGRTEAMLAKATDDPAVVAKNLEYTIYGLDLPLGTTSMLTAFLSVAHQVLADKVLNNDNTAVIELMNFISAVRRKAGDDISTKLANELISRAHEIIETIN